MQNSVVIIIPAREGSKRYPAKLLEKIDGKPLIQYVWENCIEAVAPEHVFVATDSAKIYSAVENFGGLPLMTSITPRNGTERIAEVINQWKEQSMPLPKIVINIQGDNLFLPPSLIKELIDFAVSINKRYSNKTINYEFVATLAAEVTVLSREVVDSIGAGRVQGTYVVVDNKDRALFFSRYPIPCNRDNLLQNQTVLKHIGVYAYNIGAIERYKSLEEPEIEKMEKLEQLRFLYFNIPIYVRRVNFEADKYSSIDTKEDLERAVKILNL